MRPTLPIGELEGATAPVTQTMPTSPSLTGLSRTVPWPRRPCRLCVRGRSPLEYLSVAECVRQQDAVVDLMREPPESVVALTQSFLKGAIDA